MQKITVIKPSNQSPLEPRSCPWVIESMPPEAPRK
jgi:hypothetical protein